MHCRPLDLAHPQGLSAVDAKSPRITKEEANAVLVLRAREGHIHKVGNLGIVDQDMSNLRRLRVCVVRIRKS